MPSALPSTTGTVSDLTFTSVVVAAVVFLLCVDIYLKVTAAIKTHREEKRRREQPVDSLETRLDDHEEKLKKDYARLNELEDGDRIMMRAMMALLSHDINNNSIDKLKQSMEEIQQYLINR